MTPAWVMPTADPYVTSGFSEARRHPVTGVVTAHTGTDYRAPTGTPLYAAHAGVVVRSTYDALRAGNYVRVDVGDGVWVGYSHLTSRAVGVGQAVRAGDVVGWAGATGSATASHLHFEVSVNGVKVDPELFLADRVDNPGEDDDMTPDQERLLKEVHAALGAGGAIGTPSADTVLAHVRTTDTAVKGLPAAVWNAPIEADDGTGPQTHSAARWLTVAAFRIRDLWTGAKP